LSQELILLIITAASLGFVHTSLGPDHYIPFIAMSKARHWSVYRTSLITILCGIGHVLGSVVIGIIGIAFGIAITKLQNVESTRGEIAAWLLISFGLVYLIWGLRKAYKKSLTAMFIFMKMVKCIFISIVMKKNMHMFILMKLKQTSLRGFCLQFLFLDPAKC